MFISQAHRIDSCGDKFNQGVDVLDDVLLLWDGFDRQVPPHVIHEGPYLVPQDRFQRGPLLAVVRDLHLEPLVALQDVRVRVLSLRGHELALGQVLGLAGLATRVRGFARLGTVLPDGLSRRLLDALRAGGLVHQLLLLLLGRLGRGLRLPEFVDLSVRLPDGDELGGSVVQRVLQLALVLVVGLELLLEVQDLLVPFVKPRSESDHDVPLLEKKLLVPVDLRLVLSNVGELALQLLDLHLVLGPDPVVLLLKHLPEGVRLLDVRGLTPDDNLSLHVGDPVLQLSLLLLFPQDLPGLGLQGDHGRELVLLGLSPLLLQLKQLPAVHEAL
mmetsp:Transcript_14197/g.40250  ORF Transcript_14197/g.40250 Transcript_14197/m.40250 type:complete len:329 (+) Transcript_14197:602-1588(+)